MEDEGAKASAVEAESARKAAAVVVNIMMVIEMTRMWIVVVVNKFRWMGRRTLPF